MHRTLEIQEISPKTARRLFVRAKLVVSTVPAISPTIGNEPSRQGGRVARQAREGPATDTPALLPARSPWALQGLVAKLHPQRNGAAIRDYSIPRYVAFPGRWLI